MAECPQPGQSGFVPGVFTAFALRVGIRYLREGVTGPALVDRLAERFSATPRNVLEGIATTLTQGADAAADFARGGPNDLPDLARIPVVPAEFYFDQAPPGNRLMYVADVDWSLPNGEGGTVFNSPTAALEDNTVGEVVGSIQLGAADVIDDTIGAQFERELREMAHAWGIDIRFVGRLF